MRNIRLFILLYGILSCGLLTPATAQPDDQPAEHRISIFFGGGSYYVTPAEETRLREFLNGIPDIERYQIEIQGHTDDIGPREYNQRLSEFRCEAVRRKLLAYPLPAGQLSVLPLGEDAPAFDNDTWDGKLSNRRVDIILKRLIL
jgi:outer membrane protein OmpA-like peptidoglycan-associated protein